SAGTVMCGLGLMGTAEFAKVRYAGPAIALSLGVALVAALTLTPALLRLLGQKVFWPGKPPRPAKKLRWAAEEPEGLVWGSLSRFCLAPPRHHLERRRPGAAAAGAARLEGPAQLPADGRAVGDFRQC